MSRTNFNLNIFHELRNSKKCSILNSKSVKILKWSTTSSFLCTFTNVKNKCLNFKALQILPQSLKRNFLPKIFSFKEKFEITCIILLSAFYYITRFSTNKCGWNYQKCRVHTKNFIACIKRIKHSPCFWNRSLRRNQIVPDEN